MTAVDDARATTAGARTVTESELALDPSGIFAGIVSVQPVRYWAFGSVEGVAGAFSCFESVAGSALLGCTTVG